MSTGQKIETLMPSADGTYLEKKTITTSMTSGFGAMILWFIIFAVILWFLLYSFKPTWVQKTGPGGQPTGVADAGKVLLWAIIIALVLTLLIWLIRGCK